MYDVLLSIYKINLIKKYIVRYMSLFVLRPILIPFHRPPRYGGVSRYSKALRKLLLYCSSYFELIVNMRLEN